MFCRRDCVPSLHHMRAELAGLICNIWFCGCRLLRRRLRTCRYLDDQIVPFELASSVAYVASSRCILFCCGRKEAPNRLCWQPLGAKTKGNLLRVNKSSRKQHRKAADGAFCWRAQVCPVIFQFTCLQYQSGFTRYAELLKLARGCNQCFGRVQDLCLS